MPPERGTLYRVSPGQVDQTIAALLRHWLPEHPSWGQVRRLVKARHVMINGNLCLDIGRRLKLTDVVKVLEHPTAPPAREDDVAIRFLDKHLVVVDKPSGMTSVRHSEEAEWSNKRRQLQPTLEDLLPRIIAKREAGAWKRTPKGRAAPSNKPPPTRTPPVRPVHRLDRDTSGLIVFARNVPAERHLGLQFRRHTSGRRYLAIVLGDVQAPTIRTSLVRDRGDGVRGSSTEPDEGKHAVTHVRPLEKFAGHTLVECRLETGRTHQIRIHLSELGHPLCGDKIYGNPAGDGSGAPRLALHATELQLDHPVTEERLEFHAPLPHDLKQFIERLRASS